MCWLLLWRRNFAHELLHVVCRFPGLNIVMDYLQSVLQVQVTEATGQNFGTFATINGVPLAFNLVTAANLAAGARRGFAQSCLTESNTVYQVGCNS